MTTKEAVEIIKKSNFVAENTKEWRAMHRLFDIAKRFENAVEVELKTDPYAGVCHCWIQSVPDAAKTPRNYTLYAVPKEKSNE